MTTARHFSSYTQARRELRAVLDAASSGFVTTIDRDEERFLVVSARQQREDLARLRPSNAAVIAEGGGWAVLFPGLSVHGDGDTFGDAIDDAIEALREYAEDWNDHLRNASNHSQHHALVELVELSTDEQLRDWIVGGEMSFPGAAPAAGDGAAKQLLVR